MSIRSTVVAIALAGFAPISVAAAQGVDVAARLDGRVPPAVVTAVQGIAQDAASRGLPIEPLIQKALEGGAKGAPPDRVVAAVQLVATRLDEARGALQRAGIAAPTPEAIEGGAYALNAGLNANQIFDLGRVSRGPYEPAMTLRIAATLSALGVPASQSIQLIRHMIQAGRPTSELLDLPTEIQMSIARGVSPAQAAEALDIDEGERPGGHEHHGDEGRSRPHKP